MGVVHDMKKEKILWILVCITILLLVSLLILSLITKHSNKEKYTSNTLKENEIANIKEIANAEYADFSIEVTGAYNGKIDKTEMQNREIPIYEFDARIVDSVPTENHYIGVRLTDILTKEQIDVFKSIKFITSKEEIDLEKSKIDDKVYLVFKRDGMLLNKSGGAYLLIIDENSKLTHEKIDEMEFSFIEE